MPGLKASDDFVVTNVKIRRRARCRASASRRSYQVEGIAEAELKKHLNHQVELAGQIVQAETERLRRRAGLQGDVHQDGRRDLHRAQ